MCKLPDPPPGYESVPFKLIADRKKFVGKEVRIWKATYFVHSGTVLECSGKNILMDSYGTTDWYWVPDILRVEVKT